jgi:hypothetical protein
LDSFPSWTAPIPGRENKSKKSRKAEKQKSIEKKQRGIMQIRRALTLCVALLWAGTLSPTLLAQNQNNQNNRREQERRSKQEQQDIEALVKLVDGASTGQAAPSDIPLTWEGNHFVRGADGTTYVPFTINLDRSKVGAPGVAMYVRLVSKDAAPAPAAANNNDRNRNQNQQRTFPWDNVHFLEVPADGKIQRAFAVKPGNYEIFIATKERTPERQERNAPPLKSGLLRRDITIPDFNKPELQTSSVIIASSIEPQATPLSPAQQQEQPYNFGTMKVVPSPDLKLKKSGELQVLFWVYGADAKGGKPDLTIEYNFHHKTGDAEKYFNKTAPQELNAQTLPPQFDVAAGHQLPGSLVVPLASFPEGDFRLEIKVTDKLSGKTMTENANFTVVAG